MVNLLKDVLKVERQGGKFLTTGPVRQAAVLFNTTAEDLLWNHTTFPYASAFVSAADYAKAIDEALGATSGNRTIYGVMRNAEVGVSRRRVCKQCLEEDLTLHGESYWHRSHNLPGTFYCIKHKCLLYETSFRAHGRPVTKLPVECELSEGPAAWQSACSLELAVASQALLARPRGVGHPRPASFYTSLAVDTGWMRDEGQVSQPALIRVMKDCFHDEFLKATLTEFSESRAWPVLAFNPRSCNLSPLKHLMVETLLRHGTERAGVLSHQAKGAPRANYVAVDEKLSTRGEAELQRVMAAGEKLTREDFLRRIGGKSAYTGYWSHCPKLQDVAQRLQVWNASVPKPPRLSLKVQAAARDADFFKALDHELAAAALAEFDKVVAANERLRLDAFMKRIGALTAWKFRKADCPKLVAAAERVKAWNAALANDARRINWPQQDSRLAAAAEAELKRVIVANEGLTLAEFMRRIGAASAWTQFNAKHPKLIEVARRFQLWKKTLRAESSSRDWAEIDARLSKSAEAALKKAMVSEQSLTMFNVLRQLKATRIWIEHKADCPKLAEVLQRCKAWNQAQVNERRRPNLVDKDALFARAASAELKRVMASGKQVKVAEFMKRFGARSTWSKHRKSCPQLRAVAVQLKTWNDSRT